MTPRLSAWPFPGVPDLARAYRLPSGATLRPVALRLDARSAGEGHVLIGGKVQALYVSPSGESHQVDWYRIPAWEAEVKTDPQEVTA